MPPPPSETTSTSSSHFFSVDCCIAATAAAFVTFGPSCASCPVGCHVASCHADASRSPAPLPLVATQPLVAPLSFLLSRWSVNQMRTTILQRHGRRRRRQRQQRPRRCSSLTLQQRRRPPNLRPMAGRMAMTILQQSLCTKNWKPYKIETNDIDTQALDAILALGVGCRLMV